MGPLSARAHGLFCEFEAFRYWAYWFARFDFFDAVMLLLVDAFARVLFLEILLANKPC